MLRMTSFKAAIISLSGVEDLYAGFQFIIPIWSAWPVYHKKFLPVFRLYASLPRASLLQGNASTGARWPQQYFICTAAQC